MFPFIISKLSSATVFVVEKSKKVDSKKALLISNPFGLVGGGLAMFFF